MDQGNQNQPTQPSETDKTDSGGKIVCPNCGLKLSTDIAVCPNDGTRLTDNGNLDRKLSNQYEFVSEIGSGGMGVIYKARHVALNQTVAIKMLHRMDEVSVRRFQQEAKAVTALDHPSIVRVRDFGITDSGQPHMVLDFIEGHTLSKEIEKTAGLPVSEALDIFIQACDALEHAHGRGVLHRDLKPSNIMLVHRMSGPPLVKIVDFGIAKINNPENASAGVNLTQTGEVFGSPLYMSPEQASGTKLDKRSDIYSFGCVMYETLTGAPPFVGGSSIETIFRQLNDKVPSLKEGSLGKEFPAELESIVAKALEKKPENRFQSMFDLKSELMNLKSGKKVEQITPNSENDLESTNRKKFELKALLAALVVLILLAGVTGYFALCTVTNTNSSGSKAVPEVVDDYTKAKEIVAKTGNSDEVNLQGLKLTDKMLELFGEPTKPSSVNLNGTAVVGPGLANLIHLPLKNLSMSGSALTDRGLEEIQHMENLEKLDLSKTQISNIGMRQLRPLVHLKELDLSEDPVGARPASMLRYWPELTVLRLDKSNMDSNDAYGDIARAVNLKTLSMSGSSMTDPDMEALTYGKLENLNIDNTKVTAAGLKRISSMKSLKTLSMKGCAISPDEVAKIKSESPALTIITN